MTEWLVRLKGDKFDLINLSKNFRLPKLKIEAAEDGNYYLKSIKFTSLSKADDVRLTAIQLLKIVNGVAKLHLSNLEIIELDCLVLIQQNGKRKYYEYLSGKVNIKSRTIVANLSVLGKNNELSSESTKFEEYFEIAQIDNLVAKAFEWYGELEHNFRNLYLILELVEDDVGGEKELTKIGWTSGNEIKRFKQTAQSEAVIGTEARHGSKNYKPPPKPMNLQEARNLIRTLLHQWLESKK